jgi:NHL repeat-containing protein
MTMHVSPLLKYAVAAATAIALLAGCAGGSSTSPYTGTSTAPWSAGSLSMTPESITGLPRTEPLCPAGPKVWASSLGLADVKEYAPPNPVACRILVGAPGSPFVAPFGLATDSAGRLYVADVNNSRVVVFAPNGVWLHTIPTANAPWSVCLSNTTNPPIVGVVTQSGDAEFFTNYLSAMTGQATGVLNSTQWCAFNGAGDFFADGDAIAGGRKIVYLPAASVNLPAQTLLDSGLGTATFWEGMYVQLGFNILSVGGNYEIQNFHINAAGKPVPVPALPPTALVNYPTGRDPFYQPAPSAGGVNATIYVADYGMSKLLQAPVGGVGRPGGPVTLYTNLSATVGVATSPRGQY